ncbi:hypothetical protein ONZ45_g11990 [Pleurotus djamor]|nr:hypothetical protein ONZ45_g11990 [Pleurotus djamor]
MEHSVRAVKLYCERPPLTANLARIDAITSLPKAIPKTANILSDPPISKEDHDENPPATAQRWRVITPVQADALFGKQGAGVLAGSTFFFNDGPGKRGFLGHYFHFVAEAFAGAWRVHSSSPLNIYLNTAKDTVLPTRVMFPRGNDWRDIRANLNAWFLATVLPNTAVEDIYQWEDRAKSNSVHVFSQVIIVDRWTAHRSSGSEAQIWNKMSADVMTSPAPFDWFAPLRTSLMQGLGIHGNERSRPVVTYVDRQATGRKLVAEDHEALMETLKTLAREKDIEVNAVQMEFLSKAEQFDISTRTDIMIGVHGNGLSHQMWMKPGGTVFEFFDEGGFQRDYQLLAEAMHHTHHVIWNDTYHTTWRKERKVAMTPNFNNVHLYAPLMYGELGGLIDKIRASREQP